MKGSFPALQRYGVYLAALIVVLADQSSKYLVQSLVPLHHSIPVIEGFFNITYVRNPGAAFGLLAQAGPAWRLFFLVAVSLVFMSALVIYLERNRDRTGKILYVSFALILGGAAGNLIDRIIHGEVVDFLDLYIKSLHWPAFNLADSAISIGVFLLLIDVILHRDSPPAR